MPVGVNAPVLAAALKYHLAALFTKLKALFIIFIKFKA